KKLVERGACARWFVRKITPHGGEWQKHFVDIPAVVTGVLLLLLHDSNYGIWEIVEINVFSYRIATGKKLLRRVRSQEGDTPAFAHVVPVVEAALAYIQGTDVAEWRIRSSNGECSIVVVGMCSDRILLKLGNGVLTIGRIRLDDWNVVIFPMHDAPCVHAAGLQTRAAVENDHDVFAEVSSLFFLTLTQTLARRHHQHDRYDAPRDPKHRQECA